MRNCRGHSRRCLALAICAVGGLGAPFAGCSSDHEGGIFGAGGSVNAGGADGYDAGGAGGNTGGTAGSSGNPGAGGSSAGTDSGGGGGSAGGSTGDGGAAGGGGHADDGGDAATETDAATTEPPVCLFHTDPPLIDGGAPEAGSPSDAAADAEGGAGSGPSITVQTSPFVGGYLADATGRTLYVYGADMPGDCKYLPVSTCDKDCALSWPPFDAGPRTLAASLKDEAFGHIQRADGAFQTTYYGWPLYYYKSDIAKGSFLGQGKGSTWHAATVLPASLVIMKAGTVKYLGDGGGRTLYLFAPDTIGTATSNPVSSCVGTCLDTYRPLSKNKISVVSSLEPTNFSIFLRPEGGLQVAYKGAPLYYAVADERSGDQRGATVTGWSVALP